MSVEIAAFPASVETLGEHAGPGALLDRAGALFRSWTSQGQGRPMPRVLEAWRLAERDLDRFTPGSPGWNDASERFLAARSEYRHLFDLAAVDAEALRQGW